MGGVGTSKAGSGRRVGGKGVDVVVSLLATALEVLGLVLGGQYKASEMIPSLPGLQLTPSCKLSSAGPGQSVESSDTQVPVASFSSFLPLESLGTLNLTKHLRPTAQVPFLLSNPPHVCPLVLAHVRQVLHSSGNNWPEVHSFCNVFNGTGHISVQ